MVKSVFIDYMGTTADERSPEMTEIVRLICKNSNIHDPKQVQRFVLDNRRRYEADSYLDTYLTEDEIVTRLIWDMEAQIELRGDPAVLRDLIHSHWINASVFSDARTFFDRCPVPIYVITNRDYRVKSTHPKILRSQTAIRIGFSYPLYLVDLSR